MSLVEIALITALLASAFAFGLFCLWLDRGGQP